MKILLVYNYTVVEPLGVLFLADYPQRNNHEVDIIDYQSLENRDSDFGNYDFVGFSILTGSHAQMFKIAAKIRNKAKIIIGGPHTISFSEECREHADFVVKGFGERILLQIVNGEIDRGLDARPAKPTHSSRRPSKNSYRWMKDPTIQVWCEDEVHFQRRGSLIRMWAPKGQQPRVLSPSVRHKVGFFGALNLKTGCLLIKEAPTFNAETFGDFVRYLLRFTQGKLYLILDNARWHKARDLRNLFHANQERIERIFLPPYSPELNPVERVWRITRQQITHNRYFQSVEELKTALISHFVKWEQPNSTLRVLCANI